MTTTKPLPIRYRETPQFLKDLKNLSKKRFRNLREDVLVVRNAINAYHSTDEVPVDAIKQISGLGDEHVKVYKIRKIESAALRKGGYSSRFRVIYAFYAKTAQVEFIEIYFKGNKENEDRARIKSYLQARSN